MKTIEHPVSKRQIPEFATGVFVPVFTPALEGGVLDPVGLANYCERLANDDSITSLFVRCGSGRMYDYNFDEIKQATDIAIDTVGDRKYTFIGTFGEFVGDENRRPDPKKYLDQTLELSHYAEEKGASGVVLLVPWALAPEDGESVEDLLVRHFLTVADEVKGPVFIYNTPGMPEGYKLSGSVARRIMHHPNIVGAKISTADVGWVNEVEMEIGDSHFALVSGHEGAYLQWLISGALGVIGQGCNIYPSAIRAVYDHFMAGEYGKAREAQLDVCRMLSCFAGYGNSKPGLAYLKEKGLEIQPWDKTGDPINTSEEIAPVAAGIDKVLQKYTALV